jgi:hypothetical protein
LPSRYQPTSPYRGIKMPLRRSQSAKCPSQASCA